MASGKEPQSEQPLELIVGPLDKSCWQLKPSSFQTSAELTTLRRTNMKLGEELRKRWCYTANVFLYDVEGGEAVLYFGCNRAFNIIFGNQTAIKKFKQDSGCYTPPKEGDIDNVKTLEDTLRVRYSDLDLKIYQDGRQYLEIYTSSKADDKTPEKNRNYEILNKYQRALAEKIFGEGNEFVENMKMLAKAIITKTRVYVEEENKVKTNQRPFARLSILGSFENCSTLGAVDTVVEGRDYACVGYLKKNQQQTNSTRKHP